MLPLDVVRLSIKIVGLVMFVYGVTSLPAALGWLFTSGVPNPALTALTVTIAPALLWIAIGIAFYYGAGRIVDRSIIGQDHPGPPPSLDVRAIEEVAISVLGLYVLTSGIAEAVFDWARLDLYYRHLAANSQTFATPPVSQSEFAGIAAAATRIVLGLALFVLSGSVAALRRCLGDVRPDRTEEPSER
jgi:hypothetical protein